MRFRLRQVAWALLQCAMTPDSERTNVEFNEFCTWMAQTRQRFFQNERSHSSYLFWHLAAVLGLFVAPFLLRKMVDISEPTVLRGTILAISFMAIGSLRDVVYTL